MAAAAGVVEARAVQVGAHWQGPLCQQRCNQQQVLCHYRRCCARNQGLASCEAAHAACAACPCDRQPLALVASQPSTRTLQMRAWLACNSFN